MDSSKNPMFIFGVPTSVVALKNGVKLPGSTEKLNMGEYGKMPLNMAIAAQKAGVVRMQKPSDDPVKIKPKEAVK